MVFGIFGRKFDATAFEQELDSLSEQINKSRTNTLQLEVSSRAFKRRVLKYSVLVYFVIVSYLYYVTPKLHRHANALVNFFALQTAPKLAALVGYPVLVVVVLHLQTRLFVMLQKREKLRYITLKKSKEAKIEQLKKETNFNSTNDILAKYGDKKKEQQHQQKEPQKPQQKPQQHIQRPPGSAGVPNPAFKGQAAGQLQGQVHAPSGLGLAPPQNGVKTEFFSPVLARTFQDRLLDVIIGSENNESVENRFALICHNCYSHNGLAPPGCKNPALVRYRCPNCGAFNGSSVGEDEEQEEEGLKEVEADEAKEGLKDGTKDGFKEGTKGGTKEGTEEEEEEEVAKKAKKPKAKEQKDPKDPKDPKDSKQSKEPKEAKESIEK